MIQKFRKKSDLIDAIQWDGETNTANLFLGDSYGVNWWYANEGSFDIIIPTFEGNKRCNVGDWIEKDVDGLFDTESDKLFNSNYEPA